MTTEKTTTCQICGRAIKAKHGIIAHHGYTRPGSGWQTASCYGARHLPYEVSRDLIPLAIENVEATRAIWEERLKSFRAEEPKGIVENRKTGNPRNVWEPKWINAVSWLKPEGFTRELALTKHQYHQAPEWKGYGKTDYFSAYQKAEREMEFNINDMNATITFLQKRYDSWKAPE